MLEAEQQSVELSRLPSLRTTNFQFIQVEVFRLLKQSSVQSFRTNNGTGGCNSLWSSRTLGRCADIVNFGDVGRSETRDAVTLVLALFWTSCYVCCALPLVPMYSIQKVSTDFRHGGRCTRAQEKTGELHCKLALKVKDILVWYEMRCACVFWSPQFYVFTDVSTQPFPQFSVIMDSLLWRGR